MQEYIYKIFEDIYSKYIQSIPFEIDIQINKFMYSILEIKTYKYLIDTFNIDLSEIKSMIQIFVAFNRIDLIDFFVEDGVEIGIQEIIESYFLDNCSIYKYFCDIGISDEYHHIVLCNAVQNNKLHFAKLIIDSGATTILSRTQAFLTGINDNNFDTLNYLLDTGIDVNHNNGSIMIEAIKSNSINIIKLLISHKIDLEKIHKDILVKSIQYGNLAIFEYLVSVGVNYIFHENVCMKTAIKLGYLNIIQYMIDNGTIVLKYDILDSITYSKFDILKYFLDKNVSIDDDIFKLAVKIGDLDIVKYILSKKKNFNYCLFAREAIQYGHFHIVKFFYQKRTGSELSMDEFLSTDTIQKYIDTYLTIKSLNAAAKNGYLYVVKYIIESGFEYNTDDNYSLFFAFVNKHYEIVNYLINNNYYNINQYYSLVYKSICDNNYISVKYLIDFNIHIDRHTYNKFLEKATKLNNFDIINLLI